MRTSIGIGVEAYGTVTPAENEVTTIKYSVAAFYGTDLDLILRTIGADLGH
jgi:hypothetical protein